MGDIMICYFLISHMRLKKMYLTIDFDEMPRHLWFLLHGLAT